MAIMDSGDVSLHPINGFFLYEPQRDAPAAKRGRLASNQPSDISLETLL
jgi:hypothetical protein